MHVADRHDARRGARCGNQRQCGQQADDEQDRDETGASGHDRMIPFPRPLSGGLEMRTALRLAAAATLLVGGSVLARQPASPQAPVRNVRELVARAGRYVVDYGEKMSAVVGVERYTQRLAGAGAEQAATRTLVSEFALVRAADDWVGFRDVFEVDGAEVRDRRDRILTLLLDRSSDRLLQGRRIANESARYNLGSVQRNFNTPTMALFFLHRKNQERFKYDKDGEETIDGTPVWRVRYRETGRPTIVRTTAGRSAPASGMFWIDTTSGQVVRTRMDLEAEIERAADVDDPGRDRGPVRTTVSITVSYKTDARFGVALPSEMRESYTVAPARRSGSQEPLTSISCVATYSDFRTFETFGRLIVR
jgi:hypothetical protein